MVILGSQNKITDFFVILAWASPFNYNQHIPTFCTSSARSSLCRYNVVFLWAWFAQYGIPPIFFCRHNSRHWVYVCVLLGSFLSSILLALRICFTSELCVILLPTMMTMFKGHFCHFEIWYLAISQNWNPVMWQCLCFQLWQPGPGMSSRAILSVH